MKRFHKLAPVDTQKFATKPTQGTQAAVPSTAKASDPKSEQSAPAPASQTKLPISPPDAWANAITPPSYKIAIDGVFYQPKDSKDAKILQVAFTPAWVSSLTRGQDNTDWSFTMVWQMLDGVQVEHIFPMSVISSGAKEFVPTLMNLGLMISDAKLFRRYLLNIIQRPGLPRLRGVPRLGFASVDRRAEGQALCFVLPKQTLYFDPDDLLEPVALLPSAEMQAHRGYHHQGTLEEWQTLAALTHGNALHTFALCAGFAAPLLKYSGTESGGLHFYGLTSSGKSTALQLACTVFGNGASTSLSASTDTLMNTWATTDNALEALAHAHSGMLLVIDELGTRGEGDLPLYWLLNGQGKSRMTASGGLRDRLTWTILVLTSGEVPTKTHIENGSRRRINQGEEVRLLNISVDALKLPIDASTADAIKQGCSQFFGTAGPALMRGILQAFNGDELELRDQLQWAVDAMQALLCDEVTAMGKQLQSYHRRTMRRIAVVAVGGIWAVQEYILPHTEAEVMASVRAIRDSWIFGEDFSTSEDQVIDAFRDYYLRFRGQIAHPAQEDNRRYEPLNAQGILHQNRLLLSDAQFKTACNGLDPKLAARILKQTDILHCNEDQYKSKVSVRELNIKNLRCYVIRLDKLLKGDAPDAAMEAERPPVPRPPSAHIEDL